jgi:hypothetical protein
LLEAYYYLMLQRCSCGGPLEAGEARREFEEGVPCRRIMTVCRDCRARRDLVFDVSSCDRHEEPAEAARPIADPRPSQVIDVSQWLALFHAILKAANEASDRAATRRLGFEAAQCLDEALKFYEPDQDMPPRSAFLSDESFERSRQQPAGFARSRLMEYRDRLPATGTMRARIGRDARSPRGGGWRRWFGGRSEPRA